MQSKRFSLQIQHAVLPIAIILPSAILLAIVFIIPFFRTLAGGFYPNGVFSLEGFQKAFHYYGMDIFYTLYISVGALFGTLLVAVLLSAYLRLHHSEFLSFLFKIPLFIPYVVVGHAMRTLLAQHGTLNSALSLLKLVDLNHPPSIAFSAGGIMIALIWKNIAFAILLIMAPFESVDSSYLQAAQNYGAGFFRQIKDVLLPMSRSALAVSSLLLFTSMMASFSIPMMMGNGSGPQMLMVDLYYRMTYQNDMATVNALGIISFLFSLGCAGYYIRKVVTK